MDFVVVGFGLGALAVLLGVVMLGWLAPRAQRAAARTPSPDDAVRCQAIAAEHRGTGQAFLSAGGAMLLVTVGALAGSLDDRTGALLVTATATIAAGGILLAGYFQRVRNPVPPRRRTRSAPVASASAVTPPPPVNSPSFFADEYAWDQDLAAAESAVEGFPAEILSTGDSDGDPHIEADRAPSLPAADGAFSPDAATADPLGDSSVATEAAESGSWHPTDQAAGNGGGDEVFAEIAETKFVGHVAPVAGTTESSPSRPDEEDPQRDTRDE